MKESLKFWNLESRKFHKKKKVNWERAKWYNSQISKNEIGVKKKMAKKKDEELKKEEEKRKKQLKK